MGESYWFNCAQLCSNSRLILKVVSQVKKDSCQGWFSPEFFIKVRLICYFFHRQVRCTADVSSASSPIGSSRTDCKTVLQEIQSFNYYFQLLSFLNINGAKYSFLLFVVRTLPKCFSDIW